MMPNIHAINIQEEDIGINFCIKKLDINWKKACLIYLKSCKLYNNIGGFEPLSQYLQGDDTLFLQLALKHGVKIIFNNMIYEDVPIGLSVKDSKSTFLINRDLLTRFKVSVNPNRKFVLSDWTPREDSTDIVGDIVTWQINWNMI